MVELLLPGTEYEDLGNTLREVNQPPTKWQVYEQILRVPYYAIFDRYENYFRLFQMVGTRYQPVTLTDQRYWFEELALRLAVWQGAYQDANGLWLRWQDADGNWIPTAAERAEQAQQQAAQAQQQAEQERHAPIAWQHDCGNSGSDPDAG